MHHNKGIISYIQAKVHCDYNIYNNIEEESTRRDCPLCICMGDIERSITRTDVS